MTANIHPSNKPYYDAVLDNLRAGREHGLQYKFSGDSIDWRDCEADSLGIPCVGGFGCPLSLKPGTFLLQMKPESPDREMIKIGALKLPKCVALPVSQGNDYSYFHGLPYTGDGAEEWKLFVRDLQLGDPETIAAITQRVEVDGLRAAYIGLNEVVNERLAEVQEREQKVQEREKNLAIVQQREIDELKARLLSNAQAYQHRAKDFAATINSQGSEINTLLEKIRELQVDQQQREIDRDDLADKIQSSYNKYFNDGVDFEFCLYAADAVIKHLNAKPVESGELSKVAQNIHYPECWDTVAYPTLMDALREFTCSECANPVAQEPKELVMPEWLKSPLDVSVYYEAKADGARGLAKANADLFRERGIVVPKELSE